MAKNKKKSQKTNSGPKGFNTKKTVLMAETAMQKAREGNIEEGITLMKKASSRLPRNADIHFNLGITLLMARNTEEAQASFINAIKFDDKYIKRMFSMSAEHSRADRIPEALCCHNAIIQSDPDNTKAKYGKAVTLMQAGLLEEAHDTFRSLVSVDPTHAKSWYALARNKWFEENDKDKINQLLDNDSSEQTKRSALFAMGWLHHHEKNYDEAFHSLKAANDIAAKMIPPGPDKALADLAAHAHLLKKLIDNDFSARIGEYGDSSVSPIFIIGMPRSGTSLTEQILATHSQLEGVGEFTWFNARILQLLKEHNNDFTIAFNSIDRSKALELASAYLKSAASYTPGSERQVDKNPFNFLNLWLIALMFPNARIINCIRSPEDTCLSCFMTDLEYLAFTTDLKTAGCYYNCYRELMDLWHEKLPVKILDFKYEELVADKEKQIRSLLDFCDLEWEENCLNFHKTLRTTYTASARQVKSDIFSTSVGRWINYQQHLTPLIEALSQYGASAFNLHEDNNPKLSFNFSSPDEKNTTQNNNSNLADFKLEF